MAGFAMSCFSDVGVTVGVMTAGEAESAFALGSVVILGSAFQARGQRYAAKRQVSTDAVAYKC